jgi:hypothetical protein
VRLAAFLLLVVAGTHYLYRHLAVGYPDPDVAARAWFYLLRGVGGSLMYAMVALLAALLAASINDWRAYPAVAMACLWGLMEEAQTAICRLATGMGEYSPPAPDGLCSLLTGLPMYSIGIASGAALAVYIAVRLGGRGK